MSCPTVRDAGSAESGREAYTGAAETDRAPVHRNTSTCASETSRFRAGAAETNRALAEGGADAGAPKTDHADLRTGSTESYGHALSRNASSCASKARRVGPGSAKSNARASASEPRHVCASAAKTY